VVVSDPGPGQSSSPEVETVLGRFVLKQAEGHDAEQPVTVLIRPEAARLAEECPDDEALIVEGTVSECSFRGGYYRLVIHHPAGLELAFRLVSQAPRLLEPGQPVRLAVRQDGVSLLVEGDDEQTAGG
jgi:ABC-type Fe3+/spermidine/putrescine transport system ATPase subunit